MGQSIYRYSLCTYTYERFLNFSICLTKSYLIYKQQDTYTNRTIPFVPKLNHVKDFGVKLTFYTHVQSIKMKTSSYYI